MGSAASALYVGAAIWAVISYGLYRFELQKSRTAILIAAIFAAYYVLGLLNALVHWGDRKSLFLIVERLPFLGYIFVLSRLSLSRPAATLEAMETGALIGALSGLLVGSTQYFFISLRPSAFNGNPNLFAFTAGIAFIICIIAARRHGGFREIVYWIGAIAAALSLILAGSKGMLLAVTLGGIAVLFYTREAVQARRLKTVGILVGVIAISVFVYLSNLHIVKRIDGFQTDLAMQSAGESNEQVDVRMKIWECGITRALAHPFAGTGYSATQTQSQNCSTNVGGATLSFSHFHNFLIDSAAKGGVPFFLMIIIMALTPLLILKSSEYYSSSLTRALAVATFLVFTINGLFNIFLGNDIHDSYFIYLVICIVALSGSGSLKFENSS